jgi:hypothetical protein
MMFYPGVVMFSMREEACILNHGPREQPCKHPNYLIVP